MSRRRKKYPDHPMQSVGRARPPNFMLSMMSQDRTFQTVYKECDYCVESDEKIERHKLVKLPNGLFICEQHVRGTLRDKTHDLGRSP